MNPTDEAVAKATDNLDDSLQPLEVKPDDVKVDEVIDVPAEKPDETPADGKDTKDDEGYTADALEAEDSGEVETDGPETPTGLAPDLQYVYDKLPLIHARIVTNGKTKDVQVKSYAELPEDISFASERDRLAFQNSMMAQEIRAENFQKEYQQGEQQKQNADFAARENTSIRQDIAELQRAGDLPKFKAAPDSSDFNKDPATKEVQKVLDFMNERNEKYLKDYQVGLSYRRLGFSEAFHMYQRANPPKDTKQDVEDTERKGIAKNLGITRGSSPEGSRGKPRIKTGTTTQDLMRRWDNEDW